MQSKEMLIAAATLIALACWLLRSEIPQPGAEEPVAQQEHGNAQLHPPHTVGTESADVSPLAVPAVSEAPEQLDRFESAVENWVANYAVAHDNLERRDSERRIAEVDALLERLDEAEEMELNRHSTESASPGETRGRLLLVIARVRMHLQLHRREILLRRFGD